MDAPVSHGPIGNARPKSCAPSARHVDPKQARRSALAAARLWFSFSLVHTAASVMGQDIQPANSAEAIINFRSYDPGFASAGQPTPAQLESARDAGFERIIYIAFSDHANSLPNEDRVVKSLGLDYAQIPVDWDAPTHADFEAFAGIMNSRRQKTLLHCQVNYRASAFAMLYRVLHAGVDLAEAKADMNGVWTPDETWTQFLRSVLEAHGVAPDCDGCDWTPAEL